MLDVQQEISSADLSISSNAEPSLLTHGKKELIASNDDAIRVAPSILLVDDENANLMVLELMLEVL